MPSLLEQLLHDLLQRYRFLSNEVASLAALAPDVAGYRDRIKKQLDRSAIVIEALLADPDLTQPSFARNMFHSYKRLSEYAQFADEGPVSALSRFQPRDLFLTRLVAEMCRESGFPSGPPLCSAMTNQYYCVLPHMDLMLVPHSEPDHLLGLPDIYHELGHLLTRDHGALLDRLRSRSENYFKSEIQRAARDGWPAKSIEALKHFSERWFESWVVEFGCDLFATFVCGPAFGWTNTRLCARLSPAFFEISVSHPADAARTTAIKLMLQAQGHVEEAHQIDLQWNELQRTAVQQEPQEFRLAFPTALLEGIVEEVISFCPMIGIKPYNPESMPTATLLNDAWTRFLSDPAGYRAWEEAQLTASRRGLGC